MTNETYHWLVGRCLELELQIAVLKGLETRLPAIERRDLYDTSRLAHAHSVPRKATPAEIARMRDLKRLGRTMAHIADMTGFSDSTVSRLTKDVLREVKS